MIGSIPLQLIRILQIVFSENSPKFLDRPALLVHCLSLSVLLQLKHCSRIVMNGVFPEDVAPAVAEIDYKAVFLRERAVVRSRENVVSVKRVFGSVPSA